MVIVNLSFDTLKIKNKNILASNHDKITTNHAKERESIQVSRYMSVTLIIFVPS